MSYYYDACCGCQCLQSCCPPQENKIKRQEEPGSLLCGDCQPNEAGREPVILIKRDPRHEQEGKDEASSFAIGNAVP